MTTDCTDGMDNDGDGFTDTMDPGCALNGDQLEAPDPAACGDGVDNDMDELTDLDDYGCTGGEDLDETDPEGPCNDGMDNDADGKTDHPEDIGCETPIDDDESNPIACSDLSDNDGDALMDYPFDPGCDSADDDDEADPDTAPQCHDLVDNDGDGETDYPTDPGCDSAGDDDEFNTTVGACGPSDIITDISLTGEAEGTVTGPMPNDLTSPDCRGFGGEFTFTYTIPPGPNVSLLVTTDFVETTLDTIIYVRTECRDPETELGCDDDGGLTNTGKSSQLILPDVAPGTYYVVVDAFGPASLGSFKLSVEERKALHAPCDASNPDSCVPGLICRAFTDGDPETCEYHVCGDAFDNDGDLLVDYPDEPGCTSLLGDDETDPDPLPECSNGLDDDGDGIDDYPTDPGCDYAADPSELDECVPGAPVLDHPGGVLTGDTTGAPNLLGAPVGCDDSDTSITTPERVHIYNLARPLASLSFSTEGSEFDTFVYVRTGSCDSEGSVEHCNDDFGTDAWSKVTIPNPALGRFFVIVDGKWDEIGAYQLAITGEIPVGEECDPDDTAFVCTLGNACNGGVCAPTDCNDGIDGSDAEDTLADVDDPGCTSIADNDELDPTTLPQCANGTDDDGDSLTDFPSDPGCVRAGDDIEEDCIDTDALIDVTHSGGTYTGTTDGATGDSTSAGCDTWSSSGGGPDIVHTFTIPGTTTVTVSLCGSDYDTSLYIKTECSATEWVVCNEDSPLDECGLQSQINNAVLAAGTYFIYVDGYSSGSGSYALSITGTVNDNEPCDPLQVVTGFLACNAGKSCIEATPGEGFRCQ